MAFIWMNELLKCVLIIIQAGFPLERGGRRDGGRGREENRGMNKILSSGGYITVAFSHNSQITLDSVHH